MNNSPFPSPHVLEFFDRRVNVHPNCFVFFFVSSLVSGFQKRKNDGKPFFNEIALRLGVMKNAFFFGCYEVLGFQNL